MGAGAGDRQTREQIERSDHSLRGTYPTASGSRRLVTGWSNTVTAWVAHLTGHAVDLTRDEETVAVCGVSVFDVNPSRAWTGGGDADAEACRQCCEITRL